MQFREYLQALRIMSAWVLVIIGVVIWLIAQKIPPPKNPQALRPSGVVCVIALIVFGIGAYAGLKGPVTMGGVTFECFSFAHALKKSEAKALEYARRNLSITSHPASGWRGASKKDITCVVVNTGSRSLTSLTFSFVTTDHQTVNIKVRGPYPAHGKRSVLVKIPNNVVRTYFESGMQSHQIVGAAF